MFDAEQNKPSTRSVSERLYGDLTDFERHVESRAKQKIRDHVRYVVMILILFVDDVMPQFNSSQK